MKSANAGAAAQQSYQQQNGVSLSTMTAKQCLQRLLTIHKGMVGHKVEDWRGVWWGARGEKESLGWEKYC